MKMWYAVQTRVRSEKLALVNLRRQGYEAYLPVYNKRRRHARRTDWVATPLFPRYLFVQMDIDVIAWGAINSTIGAQNIVCFGDGPAAMPVGIIEEIIAREDDAGMVQSRPIIPFKPGEEVRITEGAMCDQVGLFDCAADEARVYILLNLLGRQVRVRVSGEQLAACA